MFFVFILQYVLFVENTKIVFKEYFYELNIMTAFSFLFILMNTCFSSTWHFWTHPHWTPAPAHLDPDCCLEDLKKKTISFPNSCSSIIHDAHRVPWLRLLGYLKERVPSSQLKDQRCWPGRLTTADGGGCAPSQPWRTHVRAEDELKRQSDVK